MHPEVVRFVARFEEEAIRKGLYRKKLGEIELLFLELVLGPVFNYDFEGLSAEFPLKISRVEIALLIPSIFRNGMRFVFEIDGLEQCQKHIFHALGHWWSLSHSLDNQGAHSWAERKKRMVKLAVRSEGILHTKDVEKEFGLIHRTALNWLNRAVAENLLVPVKPNLRVIGYRLFGYETKGILFE